MDGLDFDKSNGWHVAGLWIGAVASADELLLMAPSRAAMKVMLKKCEEYGVKFKLIFSTNDGQTA